MACDNILAALIQTMRFAVFFHTILLLGTPASQGGLIHCKVLSPTGEPELGTTIWLGQAGLTAYSEKKGTLKCLKTGADGVEISEPSGQDRLRSQELSPTNLQRRIRY